MKVVLVTLCLIAIVFGEPCRQSSDCKDTQCKDSTHQTVCHHFGGIGGLLPGECICSEGTTGTKCSVQGDCGTTGCDRSWHCVDGECHCGYRG